MIEIGAVASDTTNLVSGGAAPASDKVDLSYHPYPGKNAAADASDVTMSFSDFLDMINPLQHIPVVSSIYRAVTGDSINPVSRIAGDALYGGIMGVASAGLAALGAIGDEVYAANNGGQSASATVVAALFGKDAPEPTTQLAAAESPAEQTPQAAAPTQVAALQTPAPLQSPILHTPDLAAATPQPAPAAATTPPQPTTAPTPAMVASAGPGMTLDRSKLAYGGAMDSTLLQNAQQTQALALAMTGNAGILQGQHTLHDNRFATAATTQAAPAIAPQVQANPQTQHALQDLITQLQASKALNQYKNAAQMTPIPGVSVDVAN